MQELLLDTILGGPARVQLEADLQKVITQITDEENQLSRALSVVETNKEETYRAYRHSFDAERVALLNAFQDKLRKLNEKTEKEKQDAMNRTGATLIELRAKKREIEQQQEKHAHFPNHLVVRRKLVTRDALTGRGYDLFSTVCNVDTDVDSRQILVDDMIEYAFFVSPGQYSLWKIPSYGICDQDIIRSLQLTAVFSRQEAIANLLHFAKWDSTESSPLVQGDTKRQLLMFFYDEREGVPDTERIRTVSITASVHKGKWQWSSTLVGANTRRSGDVYVLAPYNEALFNK